MGSISWTLDFFEKRNITRFNWDEEDNGLMKFCAKKLNSCVEKYKKHLNINP